MASTKTFIVDIPAEHLAELEKLVAHLGGTVKSLWEAKEGAAFLILKAAEKLEDRDKLAKARTRIARNWIADLGYKVTLLPPDEGGHFYTLSTSGTYTTCGYGCGCSLGKGGATGPPHIDPAGECPYSPEARDD